VALSTSRSPPAPRSTAKRSRARSRANRAARSSAARTGRRAGSWRSTSWPSCAHAGSHADGERCGGHETALGTSRGRGDSHRVEHARVGPAGTAVDTAHGLHPPGAALAGRHCHAPTRLRPCSAVTCAAGAVSAASRTGRLGVTRDDGVDGGEGGERRDGHARQRTLRVQGAGGIRVRV